MPSECISAISILREFQRLLHEKKSEVAALITREAGKPMVEALLTEVMVVLDATRFCVENAFDFLREQPVPHGNLAMKTKTGRILREPHGVIGIISPWNYPFSIPGDGIAVRARDRECGGAEALRAYFAECAAIGVIAASGRCARRCFPGRCRRRKRGLCAFERTESTNSFLPEALATGKRIAQAAAARLLPVVLELGGKDPMLVLETRT